VGKNMINNENIWMFHRVRFSNNYISTVYDKRGMVHHFDDIINLIDSALESGKKIGSISQSLQDKNTIHLSFDDGYKEHLLVAEKLKEKYNFPLEAITFSINIRNSFYSEKLCMDMIYQVMDNHLCNIKLSSVNKIKNKIFSNKRYIPLLNNQKIDMENYFLNEDELISLSKLFSIASHCVNHTFLTSLESSEVYYELDESKRFLESKLNITINTICYPEGKSNKEIREIAKNRGYKFGLSISGDIDKYKLGRIIPR
jgi:peptidoglycan/xylan/chitin deacetylase (PgdA/CDA1 family)